MKILIIRHGEPDYEIDSLTEKGWREAELLAERIAPLDIKNYYVSPLGRAKDTAKATLEKAGRTAEECPWLREFKPRIFRPDMPEGERSHVAWDWMPAHWTSRPVLFDKDHWGEDDIMAEASVKEEYDYVTGEFDKLLAKHGYERDGYVYRALRPNNDTIALFCHYGVTCVLLSHLANCSPLILWQGFCTLPTSVTEVCTEERQEGIASFRAFSFGDISHLYMHNELPSFSGRFCECYMNEDERH